MTLFAFIMLGVGIMIGVVLRHVFAPKNDATKTHLEEQLNTMKQSHEEYQQQVSLHFQQSANMIHEMNERQQKISLHLSKGLDDLVTEELRIAPNEAHDDTQESTERLEQTVTQEEPETIHAPVDYQK
jgi:uncharacterized protein